jgi:hypothetical protein
MNKIENNIYYKKYNKYKNKYIYLKSILVGGTPKNETIYINPIDINIIEQLLYQDVDVNFDDTNLIVIKNDISYLFSENDDDNDDDLRKIIEINQSSHYNINEIINKITFYGLQYKESTNGIIFNNVKCKSFNDENKYDLLANYKYEHRTNRVIYSFDQDDKSEYPKYYSFIISNEGIIYGKVNDGIEFGATHVQLVRNASERGIISGEIKVEENKVIFNFISSLFGFYNYLNPKRRIEKGTPTEYTFIERIKMYKLILLTKKLIELSNKKKFSEYYYTEAILFPDDNYPSEDELTEICKDKSLIIIDTKMKACGSSKEIVNIKDPELKRIYEKLESKIKNGITDDSLCNIYK